MNHLDTYKFYVPSFMPLLVCCNFRVDGTAGTELVIRAADCTLMTRRIAAALNVVCNMPLGELLQKTDPIPSHEYTYDLRRLNIHRQHEARPVANVHARSMSVADNAYLLHKVVAALNYTHDMTLEELERVGNTNTALLGCT